MITLDPTLQIAQDSLERSPIVKINSVAYAESIPFEGQSFNTSIVEEINPDIIEMSTGRLAGLISKDDDLILMITDTSKIEWFEYNFYNPVAVSYLAGSVIELSTGNLGIILIDKPTSGNYRLRKMVISTSGVVVTAVSDIYTTSNWISSPSVELLANDTFILVNAYKNSINEYSIQKRTASDFVSWSAFSTIAPSGLDNTKQINNTQVRQLASGEIFIVFDYQNATSGDQKIINCYEIRSSDNGVTWSIPTKVTDYTTYAAFGKNPVIAERADGSIEFVFQEEKELLLINSSTTGWDIDTSSFIHSIYFDPSTELITMKQLIGTTGQSPIQSAFVVDVANWEITESWSAVSSPAFTPIFQDGETTINRSYDFGKYVVTFFQLYRASSVMVIDTVADTITTYQIGNPNQWALSQSQFDPWGLTLNLITPLDVVENYILEDIVMSSEDSKLYLIFRYGYLSSNKLHIGWIDLEETPDIITELYTWNVLFDYSWSQPQTEYNCCRFYFDIDKILVSYTSASYGSLQVFNFEGLRLKHYNWTIYPNFHKQGISYPIIIDNHVYGGIGDDGYEPLYGMSSFYGLIDIDLDTDTIRYHRPSWATQNNYNLWFTKDMGDGRILISTKGEGIAVFTIVTETWVIYNSASLPGIPSHTWFTVDYDSVNKIIFAGGGSGLIAFPEEGSFQQLKYISAENTGSWVYGSSLLFANEYTNSQPVAVIDSDDVLWALWTHRDNIEYSTYWDQEIAEKDLSSYLTNDTITVNWDIGSPTTLNFVLSNGHLFEPSNTMSTLSPFVKKGRRMELFFGELISSSEYFQSQGFFIVDNASMNFNRGQYPSINITCADPRSIWKQGRIVATEDYVEVSPSNLIATLLEEYGGIDSGDINISSFVGTHILYHQFLDQNLEEMLDLILDHFNYFLYISMDGIFIAKHINVGKSVTNSYTGSEIINYAPDDTYSNFINRIVVKGEGRYLLEGVFPTEEVTGLSGTVGWWGGTEVKRVYYSDDKQKRCRNPFLEIKTSIQEFEVFAIQGGGKEFISTIDTAAYWVEITIESPNMMAMFIGLAAAIIAVGIKSITCGVYCGPYIFALSVLMQLMGYLLGSIAQYDYAIWAEPIGESKQTFQASADDLVFQRQLNGLIVMEETDDPFCYSIGSCQAVANNDLEIVKAQRNRSSFKKITHLQDEIGDKLQITHPYTSADIDLYAVSINRTYQKGQGIFDVIKGWRT